MGKNFEDETEINLADESLADCLEIMIRMTPTSMPEWMN
jgi:hypothetical protein